LENTKKKKKKRGRKKKSVFFFFLLSCSYSVLLILFRSFEREIMHDMTIVMVAIDLYQPFSSFFFLSPCRVSVASSMDAPLVSPMPSPFVRVRSQVESSKVPDVEDEQEFVSASSEPEVVLENYLFESFSVPFYREKEKMVFCCF
jgi:hypothetical protein